jgi:hypothetical protein
VIDPRQLRERVIRPTLEHLRLYSLAAESLLLGTAAQESRLGTYVVQLGGGPALGIYQMEPGTHRDIWDNWLSARADLSSLVRLLIAPQPSPFVEQLVTNLAYATAMTRLHYRRVPAPLPAPDDIEGQAEYWKHHYNTSAGRGTVEEYVRSWRRLVEMGE